MTMVGPVVALWKQQFAQARGDTSIAEEAALWFALRRKASDPEERSLIDGMISDQAESIEARGKRLPKSSNLQWGEITTTEDVRRFVQLAKGELTPIQSHIGRWLADQRIKQLTQYEYRRYLSNLAERFEYVEYVTRRKASDLVQELLDSGKTRDTIGKMLGAYRGYWGLLTHHGYLSEKARDPLSDLLPRKSANRGSERRRGFTEEESSAFLQLLKEPQKRQLDDYPIVLTMAATGMRLEEVVSLKASDLNIRRQVRQAVTGDHQTARAQAEVINTDTQLVAAHGWRHRVRTRLERA
ncbi:MAG: hypothetical protein QNJ43_26250, partial [Breoghania sp.]